MAKRKGKKRSAGTTVTRTPRQRGKLAKQRGVEAERELVRACNEAGFIATRDSAIMECTGKDTGWDVELDLGLAGKAHIQVKTRRRIAFLEEIVASVTEAKKIAPTDLYAWQLKADRIGPVIVMRREDWLCLLRSALEMRFVWKRINEDNDVKATVAGAENRMDGEDNTRGDTRSELPT